MNSLMFNVSHQACHTLCQNLSLSVLRCKSMEWFWLAGSKLSIWVVFKPPRISHKRHSVSDLEDANRTVKSTNFVNLPPHWAENSHCTSVPAPMEPIMARAESGMLFRFSDHDMKNEAEMCMRHFERM